MVAHSTPKTGVEWGTQSLGCGTEGRSLLSQLATDSQLIEMTNLFEDEIPCFQEKTGAYLQQICHLEERSVVERSAVFLCGSLAL
jgi:hypothetical protein